MSTTVINTRRSAGPLARTALLSVCLGLFAVSCGQRGPLYLPPQEAGASGNTQADKNPDGPEAEAAGEQSADDDEDAHEKTP